MTANGEISDETLMAFADGELTADAAARVEQAIAQSPALEARVAMFMATRAQARGAFAQVLTAPVPDRLLQAAMGRTLATGDASGQAAAQSAAPKPAPAAGAPGAGARARGWAPLALAASVAAVAAGLLGYLGGRAADPAASAVAALFAHPAAIADVLSTLGDGESRPVTIAGVVAAAGATHRMADQSLCRVLELAHARSATQAEALACRSGEAWRIVAAAPRPPADGNFRPAGAQGAIDAVLEARGAGPALPRADVEALKRQGWR